MKTVVVGLLAETSVHPGSGRSMGVVDLPVAREAATDYPVLAASALKGALRDRAENVVPGDRALANWFGKEDYAGQLLVSDGRLLLPVRSMTGASQWVTCPQLLERLGRDMARARHPAQMDDTNPGSGMALTAPELWSGEPGSVFLEERKFDITGAAPTGVIEAVASLIPHAQVRARLRERFMIINDDDFGWFVRYGLPVTARNRLDDSTKQSNNLWYEETLPPDTLMYALVAVRDGLPDPLPSMFPEEDRYLQAGGNETVGQGWFAVSLSGAEAVTTG